VRRRHGSGVRTGSAAGIRRAIGVQTAVASTAGTAHTASDHDHPPSSVASGTATALETVAPTIIATT
jgi:hypothetical protein